VTATPERGRLGRRWLGYLGLTVAFAIACTLLGMWQYSRNEERERDVQRIERNYDAAPIPVDEALPALDELDPELEWQPVRLRGSYETDEQLLVRGRPRDGGTGFEVLVPFRLDDGRVLVVDRGWIPTGSTSDEPESVPAAPEGEVTVVARLRTGEPEIPGRSAPAGQLATIHLPSVAELVGGDVYTGAYGALASETPSVSPVPAPAARPQEDLGPHLSYMFQWFAFGVLAFVGLGWAIRQERRVAAGIAPPERTRRSSDADEEDAILDRR